MALRTVPWLTLKRAARSISLGITSPGFHTPSCRSRVIRALICWYNGLKAGVPATAPALPAPASAAAAGGAAAGIKGSGTAAIPLLSINCLT
jgi:hypothetical protein